jgi:6-phosphogluconolactonase
VSNNHFFLLAQRSSTDACRCEMVNFCRKVFFTDERIVPLDHKDSNFANSMAALFGKVPIDRSQLVSIMGLPPDDIDLDEMAPVVSSIYMARILEELDWSADGDQLPQFDLILLGMGEDRHTCSLFPSHKLLDDQAIISWCNNAPHPPTHRITMTLSALNAAHELAFICAGSSIEDTLAAVLDQDPSPTRPASLVKLGHKSVVLFVDQAAAAKTQYPRTTLCSTLSSDTPEASNVLSAPQSDLPAPQGDLPAAQSDLPAAHSDLPAAQRDLLDPPSKLPTPTNSSERASHDGLQLEGVHLDSNASVANNELSPVKDRGIGDDQPVHESIHLCIFYS